MEVDSDGTVTTWTYDNTYQLRNENRQGGPAITSFNITHTYDPAGNRTSVQAGTTLTTYTYSPANRMTLEQTGGAITTYTHDAAGNRLSEVTPSETTYYTWDVAGRMISADVTAGIMTLTYNADGQRVLKESTDSNITGYLYDAQRLLNETDDVGDITQTYASDTTEEFGDLIGEDGEYVHQYDAEANTHALLDSTGQVEAEYKYTAFGQVSAVRVEGGTWSTLSVDSWSNLSVNDWSNLAVDAWANLPAELSTQMLAGGRKQYYLDSETELYLLGMGNKSGGGRYYDAANARFTSEDPKRQAGGDDNLYAYVSNNPVNGLDPSGHSNIYDSPWPVTKWDWIPGYGILGVHGLYQMGWYTLGQVPIGASQAYYSGMQVRSDLQHRLDIASNPNIRSDAMQKSLNRTTESAVKNFGDVQSGVAAVVSNVPGTSLTGPAAMPESAAGVLAGKVTARMESRVSRAAEATAGAARRDITAGQEASAAAIQGAAEDSATRRAAVNAGNEEVAGPISGGMASSNSSAASTVDGKLARKTVSESDGFPAGYGETDKYGNTKLSSQGTSLDKKLVRIHEKVHSILSPDEDSWLAKARAQLRIRLYKKSQIMRYAEETLAETAAQLSSRQLSKLSLRKALTEGFTFAFKHQEYKMSGKALAKETAALVGAMGALIAAAHWAGHKFFGD
jgi:RHS repeat-associated protein